MLKSEGTAERRAIRTSAVGSKKKRARLVGDKSFHIKRLTQLIRGSLQHPGALTVPRAPHVVALLLRGAPNSCVSDPVNRRADAFLAKTRKRTLRPAPSASADSAEEGTA